MVTCDYVAAQLIELVESHRFCRTDNECAYVQTNCGLPYGCGTFIEKQATWNATSLTHSWRCVDNDQCLPCPDARMLQAEVRCVAGACVVP